MTTRKLKRLIKKMAKTGELKEAFDKALLETAKEKAVKMGSEEELIAFFQGKVVDNSAEEEEE